MQYEMLIFGRRETINPNVKNITIFGNLYFPLIKPKNNYNLLSHFDVIEIDIILKNNIYVEVMDNDTSLFLIESSPISKLL